MAIEAIGARVEPESVRAPALLWPKARIAYYTAFVMILSTTFANLDIAIVPYLAGSIKADFRLSDTMLSLLVGASFGLFYTLIGLPIAWFIDRFSRRWLMAIAITTWSLGTALCGLTQTTTQLFLSRFMVGAGEAVNGPASYSILSDLFPREKLPRAIAIMKIGTIAGPAVSLLVSYFLLKTFLDIRPIHVPFGLIRGWQLVFILVGLPGVLVAIQMLTTMPEPARRTIRDQVTGIPANPSNLLQGLIAWFVDFRTAFAYIGTHWKVFMPMFASLFVSSLGVGAAAWMPIFYKRTFGWGPAKLAGLNFYPAFLLAPIGLYLGVKIAEHFARKGKDDAALRTFLIGRLIGLPAVFDVLAPNPWLTWGLAALSVLAVSVGAPAQNAAFQIVTPTELRGKMTALFLFIFSVVGVALAPVITALIEDFILHDENQIKWAIFAPAVIFGPASLLIAWLGLKPYEREVRRLKALEGAPA